MKTGEEPKKRVKREAVKSEMLVKRLSIAIFCGWGVGSGCVSVCVDGGWVCVSEFECVSVVCFTPLCVGVLIFFFNS